MKVRITYPNGLVEVETLEVDSLDALAMQKWGVTSAQEVVEGYGIKLQVLGDGDPEHEDLQEQEPEQPAE